MRIGIDVDKVGIKALLMDTPYNIMVCKKKE